MDDSGPYDVVLLPEPSLAKATIELNHRMPEDRLITLEHWTKVPHVSLYMFELKRARQDEAVKLVEELAQTTPVIIGRAARFSGNRGYRSVDYEKTPEIADLQDRVVAALNPIRNGLRDKDAARMDELSPAARATFEQYGWGSIGHRYHPHMTITKHADEQVLDNIELPDPAEFNGNFTQIALVETGENGTAAKIVAQFELGA